MNRKENINEKPSGKKMHLQLGEKAIKIHTNICIKCQSKYSSTVRENKDASFLTENSNNHRTIFSPHPPQNRTQIFWTSFKKINCSQLLSKVPKANAGHRNQMAAAVTKPYCNFWQGCQGLSWRERKCLHRNLNVKFQAPTFVLTCKPHT